MKLCIGVCSNRDHPPLFTESLVALVMHLSTKRIEGQDLQAVGFRIRSTASLLSKGREEILSVAIDEGFSHLLFLDDDMTFPPDMLDSLTRHGKRIVGVNAVRKRPYACLHTAWGLDGTLLDSRDRYGLEEVGRMGLGVALLDLDTVREIPPPHFEVRWSEEFNDYTGEDYSFFRLLREHGEKLYVDHDLSGRIGHIGQTIHSHQYFQHIKEES